MSNDFNFNEIPAATAAEFLEPGMWRLSVDKEGTKFEAPKDKTPYLLVKFVSKKGGALNEKFFLTPKAMPRLQYLHTAWFEKPLEKQFSSVNEVAEYFIKALTSKIVDRPMITGGKLTGDGKFYSGLPYTNFVVREDLFEEGPFEKDSPRYLSVVKREDVPASIANSDLPVANTDDLPW